MPIYEYQCEACGERVELLQRFEDPPPAACAHCGGAMRKLLSAPAFQFKGSGWYVTDYAGKSGGNKLGGEGGEKKEGSDAGEAKSAGKADSTGENRSESKGKSESTSESKSEAKSESSAKGENSAKSESKPAS